MTADQYWKDSEVEDTLRVLRDGGLILVKGDIGYGLFGTSEDAIRRMYEVKGRVYTNPCIFVADLDVLDEVADVPDPRIRRWVADLASWTTCAVVLPARRDSRILAGMDPWVRQQSVTNDTLALFLRTGPFLDVVIRRAFEEGWAFVGSSANRSSEGNRFRPEELPTEFFDAVDLFVDHGVARLENPERMATTIVNLTNWTIKRRGVEWERITKEFEALRDEVGAKA